MKTLIAILAFTVVLSATPIDVTLLNGGSIPGDPVISPYGLAINGQDYQALCFDFADPSYLGQTWNANIDTLSNVTYFTNQPNYTAKYLAEIELFSEITTPGITPANQTAIQLAAWQLFDGNAPSSPLSLFYEQAALNSGAAGLPGLNVSNYRFVESPNDISSRAQAFVIEIPTATPDVPAYASVGLGLVFVGLLAWRRRG